MAVEVNSASAIACIPAATVAASVPLSSPAANSIEPRTSSATIAFSSDLSCSTIGVLSLVLVLVNVNPALWTWVIFTSSPAPKFITWPSVSKLSIGVVISKLTSAIISNWPLAEELIANALSLNCNAIASFNRSAVSWTWVNVTSLLTPNPSTAASLSSLRSLLISTAVEALMSTVGAVISNSTSASISNWPLVLEFINNPVSRNCIFLSVATKMSSASPSMYALPSM